MKSLDSTEFHGTELEGHMQIPVLHEKEESQISIQK